MRLGPGIRKFNYSNRLKILNPPTLDYKRKQGTMIEVYQTLNGVYDAAATEGLNSIKERYTPEIRPN